MLQGKSDEEIVQIYKEGNKEAFKELIDRYSSHLYNFSARLAGKNNASDIVQETFIKVWGNMERFDPKKASFKTWIFRIAKNSITDFLRKKKMILFSDMGIGSSEETDSFLENIPDENLLPDEMLQKLEEKEFLNKTLDKLRYDYREILLLHYQEDMTFDEIGKILGQPLNTVKSKHYRAMIELRKNML